MRDFKVAFVAGCSIFAMMFGSSNVVMPALVVRMFPDSWFGAYIGFALMAVVMPLVGLFSMFALDGSEKRFYAPIGNIKFGSMQIGGWIQFWMVFLIMVFMCPLGGIPRSITVAVGALSAILPSVDTHILYVASHLAVLAVMFRETAIIDILSKYLSPVKIISLVSFVILGIDYSSGYSGGGMKVVECIEGCKTGYLTTDLVASVMFSAMLVQMIKARASDPVKTSIIASSITGLLLGIVYFGFFLLYSSNQEAVAHVDNSVQLLSAIAEHSLGRLANIFVSCVIAITCFTTVVALMTVWIQYLERTFLFKRYHVMLLTACAVSYFISTMMRFEQILVFMTPVINVVYPIMIVLSVVHIVRMCRKNDHKRCGVEVS